jgi:hypothetical protein
MAPPTVTYRVPGHQAVQAHSGVADDDSGVGVHGADAVQAGHVEDGAAGVLRGVAVGPSEAPGDGAAGAAGADRLGGLLGRAGTVHAREGRRGAAPAREGFVGLVGGGDGCDGGGGCDGGDTGLDVGLGGHGGDRIALPVCFAGIAVRLVEMGD